MTLPNKRATATIAGPTMLPRLTSEVNVPMIVARMAYGMAIDLLEYEIALVYLSLGWFCTEHLVRTSEGGKLNDMNYLDMKGYENTESTRYVGRAIVALASDSNVLERTGQILITGELAQEYGFTDIDGTQPIRFKIPDKSKSVTQR